MVIVLSTSNPAYKAIVLVAALTALVSAVGLRRMRRLLAGVGFIAVFDVLLNFVSAHLGRTVLFALPDGVPAIGGPYTLEALAFGVSGGMTIAAAAALGGFIGARAAGWAGDWFAYPSLTLPPLDLRPLAACLLLFAPVVTWRRRG